MMAAQTEAARQISAGHSPDFLPPAGKLIHLEAARGIASLIVLVHHFALAFAGWIKGIGINPIHPFWPFNLFSDGSLAVSFFFVLSGFVLPLGLYRRASLAALAVAVLKRLPRLWLPAALSIVAGYVVLTHTNGIWTRAAAISGSGWLADFGSAGLPPGLEPSLLDALRQSLMVFLYQGNPFDNSNFYYSSNLWTMHAELLGSMIVYGVVLMVLLTRATHRKTLFVALHVLAFGGSLLLGNRVAIFFSAGTLLASLYLSVQGHLRISRLTALVLVAVFLLAGTIQASPFSWTSLVAALSAMVLLLACPRARSHLSGRLGSLLGELSFPLYLVHTLAILAPGSFVYVALSGQVPEQVVLLVTFAVVLIISLAGAGAMVFIDRWWVGSVNRTANTVLTVLRGLTPQAKTP